MQSIRHWAASRLVALLIGAALFVAAAPSASAADPAKDFKQNCYGCHTIGGGRRTGPDLKDATKRKDRAWLMRMIMDPGGMLDSGDPYAQKILEEARGQRMTPVAGMNRDRASALIDLIEAESVKAKDDLRFPGITVSARPFTKADIARGRDLFLGLEPLKRGGPSCVSCHTVGGVGGLGGGRLGPDLTKIFEKHETRKQLASWLSSPATQTMQPTFREKDMDMESEILPLIAYFQNAAATEAEDTRPSALIFALLGIAGAIAVVLLFNRAWASRFRAVRKPLLKSSALPGTEPNPHGNS